MVDITYCEPGYAMGYMSSDFSCELDSIASDTIKIRKPLSIMGAVRNGANLEKVKKMENYIKLTADDKY